MLCQIATLLRARSSKATPLFAFASQSRFATFHFDGTWTAALVDLAADAGFGAAPFGAADLFVAEGAVTGTAGVEDLSMANVSEPPATTSSPVRWRG